MGVCRAPSRDSLATSVRSKELRLAFSDWLLTPEDIQICKRSDGSDWELGAGGFGRVSHTLSIGQ